jgi:hypothetical protein
MPFYPAVPAGVTSSDGEDAVSGLPGGAWMVAVRVADPASPARRGLGKDGRSALVAPGAGRICAGDLVVFLKPVAIAPAVVRRDGRVQAAGHPADHARLGLAEERLDALCGTADVIGELGRAVTLKGKVKGEARRAMTAGLAIRFTLLMTLMNAADYAEVMAALIGDLAGVPWQRPYALPAATVASAWRQAAGPEPLEELRDMLLAAIDAGHRDHDYRAVTIGDLEAHSIDGSLTRVPDTPANRQALGPAGTADDSSPYPQLRELRLSNASTRATLAVVFGPSGAAASGGPDKGEAEQKLLDKALENYPHLFTDRRIWIMDRNFPGAPRIRRMLATGTHVLIRVKDGITLTPAGAFAPGGSYPGRLVRRRRHADPPRDRVPRQRRRAGRPRAARPDHRPPGPRRLPGAAAGRRLPLAVDRVGNLPEGSQIGDQRRRAVHRADAPLRLSRPDRRRARRLGDRHRADPRDSPRRCGHRRPRPQGQARRTGGPPPRDIVHRRAPSGHHHHPHRRGHRQPARPGDHRQPRPRPG